MADAFEYTSTGPIKHILKPSALAGGFSYRSSLMFSGIYRFKIDYDLLASYSLPALKGYSPGWCYPVLVSQTPLIYDLYVDRFEEKPDLHPGHMIGQFELRRRPGGGSEILFLDKTSSVRFDRDWTDAEKDELRALSTRDERVKLIVERRKRIQEKEKALQETLKKHFEEVVKVYFRYLEDWDITPNIAASNERLGQDVAGIPEGNPLPPLYADTLEEVKKLSLLPLSVKQIAMRLVISESTVKRYRKQLGIKRWRKK